MIKVFILTVSDRCARGEYEDVSSRTIAEMLPGDTFQVCERRIAPDDQDTIAARLVEMAERRDADLVLTTGGTGLGPRDVTAEATAAICERMVPGFGELMRAEGFRRTPNAALSRATAGILSDTLIVNLPGSPRAVRECLEVILPILPHAVEMMHGGGH